MDRLSTGVTLVMLALFTAMVAIATTYPAGARFMPLVIGIPAIGLCLLQLVLDLRRVQRGALTALPRLGNPATVPDEAEPDEPARAAEVRVWIYFTGFIGGVLVFGFFVAAPVLVTLYLWREAAVRLRRALASAAVFALLLFVVFHEVLDLRLHEGFVTGYVLDRLAAWVDAVGGGAGARVLP